jgi:hypothetical protein
VELIFKVGVVSRWRLWPTVGMRLGRSVVMPNMAVFHDDIGAFVSIGRFPTDELGRILFFLINENKSLLPCFFFLKRSLS